MRLLLKYQMRRQQSTFRLVLHLVSPMSQSESRKSFKPIHFLFLKFLGSNQLSLM